ncbi:MAG: helix-turn-helix domain-containing protein [Roseateles sp.]|uniref:helix-turn-helix domain-containing protein n=1 Tax=Roseateles sp. TaxID=1971397 RepID=UPI0040372D12
MSTYSPTVDVAGAADLMKVHPQTVLDKIASGELRAGKMGRSYVMLTADVLKHIEEAIVRETAARMRTPLKPAEAKPRRRTTTPA